MFYWIAIKKADAGKLEGVPMQGTVQKIVRHSIITSPVKIQFPINNFYDHIFLLSKRDSRLPLLCNSTDFSPYCIIVSGISKNINRKHFINLITHILNTISL